ncbi:MAG: hypothetical protein DRO95_02080 [Candidatus Altiarchaeales archaeon]|nr:MAG: hypothetical protein DRO95_02080 [Candidatus Altiarchaeales archaeon]HDO82620.1 hypothetical protein [Candidatus Altiarchaeales archaeon]HEX55269.1 hypothetical protein [Candidatus Altiarchaeales archaeon]
MIPNPNPVVKRLEMILFLFILLLSLSLVFYAVTGNELWMWRFIALDIAISSALFIVYPFIRGIRAGDIIMISVLREIETPFMEESFVDNVPTIAIQPGRINQNIEVQFGDGSRGVVKIRNYGIFSFPEGALIELEKISQDTEVF